MREFESIRNAARVLFIAISRDYEAFLIKKDHKQISADRINEIQKAFDTKFMELKQIENAVNRLSPFENAANRHIDNRGNGVTSIAYRQAFDRENLRREYLEKYKTN
jgi:hypothetical protein